jgi:quinoprotein glucose dehydrogenase
MAEATNTNQEQLRAAKRGGIRRPRIYAIVLALIALSLIVGGAQLALLAGSLYYLLAGIALGVTAFLVWTGRREGVSLYGAIVVLTAAWAFWEVGFDPWALMPRIAAWLVVGSWMLLPAFRRRMDAAPIATPVARIANWPGFAGALLIAIGVGFAAHGTRPARSDPRFQNGIVAFPSGGVIAEATQNGEWREWGNDAAGTRFSSLTEITPDNIDQLEIAWRAPITIDPAAAVIGAEVTPIMVGGVLYSCNGLNEIFAHDAETGALKWQAQTAGEHGQKCRGVAYYETPDAPGLCARRIIAATGAATLVAFDAMTGAPCPEFGRNGSVDLLTGLNHGPAGYYFVTSAPAIVRGKIVLGGWVTDGQYWGEPSGVIRAFDAVTGELAWAWDMGRPDSTSAPPPGETYTPATPNSWAPISADETLGLVYLPTGNATPDYFGAQRRAFDDQYSSSVVALEAETGRLRWSFQTTHHDLWDYDVPAQPTLVDIARADGGVDHALIQSTKRGEVFVLDRATGHPLRRVEEMPTPQDGIVPEDRLSPTQPFSTGMPSFRAPDLIESDMWGVTPLDQLACRLRFRQARYEGPFTPPGLTPSISSPGQYGAMNWGGVSVDRDHGVMIVNTGKIAQYNRLLPRSEADAMGLRPAGDNESASHTGQAVSQTGTPYGAAIELFLSPIFVPCEAPPYGFISAVDLASGQLIWTRTIGSARDTGPLGLGSQLPLPLGTPMIGGSMTTRSGLVFIAATMDRTIRALDVRTGRTLWSRTLPNGGYATPMTYTSPRSGRQFVVIATGKGFLGGADSAELVAFALPRPAGAADVED